MRFEFIVEAELNRTQGKFETRESLGEMVRGAIEEADPGSLDGENGGEYEVSSWSVTEGDAGPPTRSSSKEKSRDSYIEDELRAGLRAIADAREVMTKFPGDYGSAEQIATTDRVLKAIKVRLEGGLAAMGKTKTK